MEDSLRPELHRDDVVPNLWRAYKKTAEYKNGRTESISSIHPIVRKREAEGLNSIFIAFVSRLQSNVILKDRYISKNVGEWIADWKRMHNTLFHNVLKLRGDWRTTEVRFGAPGDEDRHRIPKPIRVQSEMQEFAYMISKELASTAEDDIDAVCSYLAKVHYQFIRIHPFLDGNGRIARVLTDQLAVAMGLPPVVTGFPRTDDEKKRVYHEAITACISDPSCAQLMRWIKDQIERKIKQLA